MEYGNLITGDTLLNFQRFTFSNQRLFLHKLFHLFDSSYGLQVPKQLYEICDFPNTEIPRGVFLNGAQVQSYLENYASANDLNKIVRLNTKLEKAEKRLDGRDGWILSTKDDSGVSKKEEVDYLIISTGMYSRPNLPHYAGEENFEGKIMHSSEFTENAQASGKHVVVIGSAKSAIDVVVDSSKVSKRSTLLYRNAHWSAPRKIAGLIPFQYIFLSRFGQGLVSWYKGAWPGSPKSVHTANAIFSPMMGAVFGIVEALFQFQLGYKGDYTPKDDIVKDFYGYANVLDNSFKKARESDSLSIEKGTIAALGKDSVTLTSGKIIPCDILVCSTGYEKSYTYFDKDVVDALKIENDGLYLYRHCLPPSVSNLAFIGSEVATISNIMTYGIMAEWLARALSGKMKLPSKEIMTKEVEDMKEWKR